MKRTVLEMLTTASEKFKDKIYIADKTDNGWKGLTFNEVEKYSSDLAIGLIQEGIKPQDKIAIISEGRCRWIISEYAILKTKAICVPLSTKLQSEEIAYRIEHSECKYVIISQNCISKILEMSEKLSKMNVKIIYIDEKDFDYQAYIKALPETILFSDLLTSGEQNKAKYEDELRKRINSVVEDDVVTISYTSGTTGNPKGIMLTHLNYWANAIDAAQYFRMENDLKSLVILPLDHSFAHTICFYLAVFCSMSIYFVDSRGGMRNQLKNIFPNIKEVEPDMMLTVPTVTGNFMRKIYETVEKQGKLTYWIFKKGLKNGMIYFGDGYKKPNLLKKIFRYPIYKLADRMIFSKIRKMLGKNFKFFIGGGAMLEIKQQKFFNCIGLPIMQGYGLSEASPIVSVNQRHNHKFGSSGGILSGIDCKILDANNNEVPRGETGYIVVEGHNVMKGYYKNQEATKEVIDEQGRLHTGDMGYIDKDGFLFVTGRERALLISKDGEKYSPEEIEDAICTCSEFIHQCVLYCDHSKYTSALITLDQVRIKNYIQKNKVTTKEILDVIGKSFYKFTNDIAYKKAFPPQWIPSVFRILPETFTEQNQMLNSSMKIKRFKVIQTYKDVIDKMYESKEKISSKDNLDALEKIMENIAKN
ncbi:MAG: AMP-binding protein [Bacteroidales bacterium]|nr:AMP-binding protein [Bacteroidales bacterium]